MTENAFHKIKKIEVTGGFLDGLSIDFSDGHNCIIGGRGTGKTTILEFTRYALDQMSGAYITPELTKSINKLLRNNLGSGRIRVEIETKNGVPYFVEKSYEEETIVVDEKGERVSISLERGTVFNAEVYSQNQIEEIAKDPFYQLNMIDKFVHGEILETKRQLDNLTSELDKNSNDIIGLRNDIGTFGDKVSELKEIQEKLKAYKPAESEASKQVALGGKLKQLREKEKKFIDDLNDLFDDQHNGITDLLAELSQGIENAVSEDLIDGENEDVMTAIKRRIDHFLARYKEKLIEAQGVINETKEMILSQQVELQKRHATQEKNYQDLLEKFKEERESAKERDRLQKQEVKLQEAEKTKKSKEDSLKQKIKERENLMKQLSELRDKRYNLRREVVKKLNDRLEPMIRIRLEQYSNKKEFEDTLSEALKGSGMRYAKLVEKISERLSPREFILLVQKADTKGLIDELDIEEERAQKIVAQLRNSKEIYSLETVELYDRPTIELMDGEQYKSSDALSTGQKCTTILPILLTESAAPLLIDQPEDNLDNAFVFDTVVRGLENVKGKRQLIFVTHNPNIPVLGDAEKIFVMESDGANAMVKKEGGVNQVKVEIETILEGGEEAFIKRKELYGY